jgi:hypothetical protein
MHIIDLLSINNPNFANWIPLQNNEDTKGVIRSCKSKKDITVSSHGDADDLCIDKCAPICMNLFVSYYICRRKA